MIELSKKFGTPLYLLYEDEIVKSCELFRSVLRENFGEKALAFYACKALSCKYLCKIINEQNLGLDVSSGGELFTASLVGFPMGKVMFHGNNKTEDELEMSIKLGVFRIVVDNLEELEKIEKISNRLKKTVNILIRVRPEVDANTHSSIKTAGRNSKFGMSFNETFYAIKKIIECKYINIKGFHAHIGSQIFDVDSFVNLSEIMINFYINSSKKFNIKLSDLNLGGGFGVGYIKGENDLDLKRCMRKVSEVIKIKCKLENIEIPYIYVEPGRSIIAKAGVTLYTIGCVKRNSENTHVIVDGSMNDNPRFALYGSKYSIENISKKDLNEEYEKVLVSGRCCESGDIISSDCLLKKPSVGDILAVYCTGAYNFSMSSNYNKFCKPPIILIKKNGECKQIVRRQTYEDLVLCEI